MDWHLDGFDLDAFVRATLAEDLGVGFPGGGRDVTAESVIPAAARGSSDARFVPYTSRGDSTCRIGNG